MSSSSSQNLAPFVASVLRDGVMSELMEEIDKLKLLVDEHLLKVQITGRKGSPIYYEGSLKDGYCSHRGRCFEVMFDEEDDDNDNLDNDEDNDNDGAKVKGKAKAKTKTLPPSALKDLEIRLGNTVIQRLDNIDTILGSCNSPFFTDDNFYRDNKYNKKQCFHPERKEIIFKTTIKPNTTNNNTTATATTASTIRDRHRVVPVPFLIARFGPSMTFAEYYKLDFRVTMSDLMELYNNNKISASAAGKEAGAQAQEAQPQAYDVIIEGLTFSKDEIKASMAVLEKMGYNDRDVDNDHRHFVKTIDTKRQPVRNSQ